MLWQTGRHIYAFRTSQYHSMQTCLLHATNTNEDFGNQKSKTECNKSLGATSHGDSKLIGFIFYDLCRLISSPSETNRRGQHNIAQFVIFYLVDDFSGLS